MSKRIEQVLHTALKQVVSEFRRDSNEIMSEEVIVKVNENLLVITGLARALRTERRHTAQEECFLPFSAKDW